MRRLWAIPALALWVAAVLYRCVVALEAPHDGKESWGFLAVLLGILAGYVLFLVTIHMLDIQWTYGWRK